MKKIRQSLGFRISLAALVMCLLLCAAAISVSYVVQNDQLRDTLAQNGYCLSAVMEEKLPAEDLVRYAELDDEEVVQIASLLRRLAEEFEMERIVFVQENTVVLDSSAEVDAFSPYELGAEDVFYASLPQLRQLRTDRTDYGYDAEGMEYLITMHPVAFRDGTVAGYILTAAETEALKGQMWTMVLWLSLILAAVMIAVLVCYLLFVRKIVILPIRKLTDAVQAYEGGENKTSLRRLEVKGNHELQSLADAFRMMLVEIDLRGFEERELAVREERVEAELKLTTAVNAAMEPKALPRASGRLAFDVSGLTSQTGEMKREFYDYFLLEDGNLGFVLGEVPGEGVSAALFMVVAKTVIKSQLRVGMSLPDAMVEANRQLFEVGQGMVVNALIGVLDENGVCSFVNAGQQQPLLMRAQDRYEKLNTPVYASLGQNENVTYQIQEIQLRQGDRVFFHTSGFWNICGKGSEAFGLHRLQASLNESRSKRFDTEGLLRQIRDDGLAFSERPKSVGGFALLALDYLRARKDLAHCVIVRDWNGAEQLSNFLKRQLRENGYDQRAVAQVVVLADEVFSLCCRQRTDSLLTVECEVDKANDLIILNWKSAFGSNPLVVPEGSETELAVNFIRNSSREITFTQKELQDVLTIKKQL